MQLAIGRRRVLKLRFSVAIQERMDGACSAVRSHVERGVLRGERAMQWERDKISATMLSGWDATINRPAR